MNQGIFLHDVSYRYAGASANALSHLTAHIPKGAFFGVTGPNGSGKSTFSHLLNGLIPNEIEGKMTGEVTVDGVSTKEMPVSHFAKKVGMVFQNPDNMIFNLTVAEEIEFGIKNLGLDNIGQRVREALLQVGLSGYENKDPHTLSFGQKQKLCIAACLAMETDYLVLDEPSAMLDYKSSVDIYRLLKNLNSGGKTIVVVEHDTDYLYTFADHIIIMHSGALEIDAKTQDVFADKGKIASLGVKIPHKIYEGQ